MHADPAIAADAVLRAPSLRFTNRFANLGAAFYTELPAQPIPDPHWVAISASCASMLGLPDGWSDAALPVFSGHAPWPGMRPLASVYSGHQFGVWAGQLGDGRALWLGEIETPAGPMELQLKGSGHTPYSRMGDGRAVLRSSVREFLCSEAMAGLGIPTTRALCITGSALPVHREVPETAAIVTRVAPSFIRYGHFEHFAHHDLPAQLKQLADFTIDAYFPACRDAPNPYAALLEAVTRRTAALIAQWQAVGFCHGVMNTDNLSILGLTIDYGPFGFLDAFDPRHICNHSDHQGRYAYAKQPNAAFWNLHALAQALLPLIGAQDEALAALEPFKTEFPRALTTRFRAKLGLATDEEGDAALIDELLGRMAADRADMTITFRRLGDGVAAARDLFIDREAFDAWARRYVDRLARGGSVDALRRERMNRVNPKFVLRNHLAQGAIEHAQRGEFGEIDRLRGLLETPFDEHPDAEADAGFPPDWANQLEISCSS